MDARDEWCFDFRITSPRAIGRDEIHDLFEEAVAWAEANRLGVGGGYRPASPEVDRAARSWAFFFGLSGAEEGQVVPRRVADGLWGVFRAGCERRGLGWAGGFRPFSDEDFDDGLP